jgi:hypothetical protein
VGDGPISLAIYDPAFSILGETADNLPQDIELFQNYPNPFNPGTVITFQIHKTMSIQLDILNIRGQVVSEIFDGIVNAGIHSFSWNGRSEHGGQVASGQYFYRLRTPGLVGTKKMMLLK